MRKIRREFEDNEDNTKERKPMKAVEYLKENQLYEKNCRCPHCKTELLLKGKYTRDEIIKIKIFPSVGNQKDNHYHKKKA